MAVRKFAPKESAADRALKYRLQVHRQHRSPLDRTSRFHEEIGELARSVGVPTDEIYEEWSSRSAAREYDGGYTRDEAEQLAMTDVKERYEARTKG